MVKKSKSQILNELIAYKGFRTKTEFASFVGILPQTLSKWLDRNTFDTDTMIVKFPEINPFWLVTGDGPMLLSEATNCGNTDNRFKGDHNIVIGSQLSFEKIIAPDGSVELHKTNPEIDISRAESLTKEILLLKEENKCLRELVNEYKQLYLEYKSK